MGFLVDTQELKSGLIIFKRADVKHEDWYCRVKVPGISKYKTVSLKTPDIREAKDKAFDIDADIRFRVKHEVPVFEKSFAEVAQEYSAHHKSTADAGQITMKRWLTVDGHIRLHLIPYIGNLQITLIGEDKFRAYPLWRKQNHGKTRHGAIRKARDGTIRQEMMTYKAIMNYAADKGYIRERQIPKGKMPVDNARRDEFTPSEYRQLHTYARQWIKEAGKTGDSNIWYRTMAYNFMLIMCNTGMRTSEARNLKWKDIDTRLDRQGRPFVTMNVSGKGKFRQLVAANNVATYIERIKAISKSTKPEDFVFTIHNGRQNRSLYTWLIKELLTESGLLISANGQSRSTYCFRHTYATFRLMEGIDVYFLAKQMGTSVKMIENHYGHITPAKNAERILQGVPGWEPIGADDDGGKSGGVNAALAGKKAGPRTKKDE